MPQCVVIADDLTGANATGVLLKKMNYKAFTVMNSERIELSTLNSCDCVLYPNGTESFDGMIFICNGMVYSSDYSVLKDVYSVELLNKAVLI